MFKCVVELMVFFRCVWLSCYYVSLSLFWWYVMIGAFRMLFDGLHMDGTVS